MILGAPSRALCRGGAAMAMLSGGNRWAYQGIQLLARPMVEPML